MSFDGPTKTELYNSSGRTSERTEQPNERTDERTKREIERGADRAEINLLESGRSFRSSSSSSYSYFSRSNSSKSYHHLQRKRNVTIPTPHTFFSVCTFLISYTPTYLSPALLPTAAAPVTCLHIQRNYPHVVSSGDLRKRTNENIAFNLNRA